MPDRRFKDVKHSFIIEFKYVNANSSDKEILDKLSDAAAQLNIYAADEKVKNMTFGTEFHKIVMVFKGLELEKIEEI